MTEIRGTIVESRGPYRVEAPPDPWKWVTAACVFAIAAPVWVGLAVASGVFRLTLALAGCRRRGPRTGLLGHAMRSIVIRPFRAYPQPLHVYDHVVETERGVYEAVRQHGEFRQGRLFPGHRVVLRGWRSGGSLRVRSAVDETVGTSLAMRQSPWLIPGVLSAMVLAALTAAALGFAGTAYLP